MPSRSIPTSLQREKIVRNFQQQSYRNAQRFKDELVHKVLIPLYEKTFAFWGDSGQNKFPRPTVIARVNIVSQGERGHKVVVRAYIENQLWNWLDKGTPDIIQPKTSPPIPERKALRTAPDELDVSPFPGFTGRFFRIRAGSRRRGIPPRNWTIVIVRRILSHKEYNTKNKFVITKAQAHGEDIV